MRAVCERQEGHKRTGRQLSYEERALQQNRRFVHWGWLLPVSVAIGAVATVLTGVSVWTSAGCAAGIALWFIAGGLALWARR
ncbi:hypothetical protein GCM10009799_22700 [Nocardiopsis rhodophaea]|uniref:Uncharacterized protein n=1 Tax=Nocardiopsis rhodophaea TaxID=280238 RepID=A0ABN2T072_9ACTN